MSRQPALLPVLAACAYAGVAAAWSTTDQFLTASVTDTSVSRDGRWVLYAAAGNVVVDGRPRAGGGGQLAAVVRVTLALAEGGAADNAVSGFCASAACGVPRFCDGDGPSRVVFVGGGDTIYQSTLVDTTTWTPPRAIASVDAAADQAVVALQCVGGAVYYSVSQTHAPPALAREVADEVIIDVISGAGVAAHTRLCRVPSAGSSAEASCFHEGGIEDVGVGAPGYFISCWPYPTDFDVNPRSTDLVAITTAASANVNQWERLRAQLYDTAKGVLTPLSGAPSFQAKWSADGSKIAFTEVDGGDYVWAQTWHVCVYDVASGGKRCGAEGTGTRDQAPTLVGWGVNDTRILYLEQDGTGVGVQQMDAATLRPVGGVADGLSAPHEVIGGGFRASMAPVYAVGAAVMAVARESPTRAPEVYLCDVDAAGVHCGAPGAPVSQVNDAAPRLPELSHAVVRYTSFDGTPIEAVSLGSANTKLLVFTHCGPAMAQLSTYLGFGTVCAGFPVISLVLAGYHVLMPNYRGSSGYGSAFRRLNRRDWGGKDYNDVLTAMQQYGTAVGKRVGHFGWSYGGYMSALVLTKARATHGVEVEAVVSGGTLTNLVSHVGTTDIFGIFESVFGGDYWAHEELLETFQRNSGMYHVHNASAPTLLLHGVDDPRMPLSQAWELHRALRARSVTNKFVVFPGSGHIPVDANQRRVVCDETVAWFQEHF